MVSKDGWNKKVVFWADGEVPGTKEKVVTTKGLEYLASQFLGGVYTQAGKLIRDYPELRKRWTLDELEDMYNIFEQLEVLGAYSSIPGYGLTTKRGAKLMLEYLELRGDEGDLVHCQEYSTSEYCVIWWMMREAERKEKRASETVEERIERNWRYREYGRKGSVETEEERVERKKKYVEQAKVRFEVKRGGWEGYMARFEKELEEKSLEELEEMVKEIEKTDGR